MNIFQKKLNENSIEIDDMDMPIYRVFSRSRFLELISTKQNTLVKPKKWDDPFENFLLKCHTETDNGEPISLEIMREKWYGQCWTTHKDTDAMWRIYSHNKDGIRVKTTPNKLFNALVKSRDTLRHEECFIGAVRYLSADEINDFIENSKAIHFLKSNSAARTLLMKRKEFEHEKEIRIIFHDANRSNKKDIYSHAVEINNLIEEITLDPRSTQNELEMLSDFLEKKDITATVNKSHLYEFSPKKINFS